MAERSHAMVGDHREAEVAAMRPREGHQGADLRLVPAQLLRDGFRLASMPARQYSSSRRCQSEIWYGSPEASSRSQRFSAGGMPLRTKSFCFSQYSLMPSLRKGRL